MKTPDVPSRSASSLAAKDDLTCENCGGPMTWRQAYPHPVGRQIAFGLSFLVFLFLSERFRAHPQVLYLWCGFQALLGYWLIRGRIRARGLVLRCVRCTVHMKLSKVAKTASSVVASEDKSE